ncbi:hypothetical protein BG006_001207 [Podila minutissima]|uniref:Uncharacterized protein n=1 Tax=Podila minutissima TaxID=64525 RepID=A0A9P5SD26_9FUNG|nr:hypothetical protein BG006_001207 [Podila minutissima]
MGAACCKEEAIDFNGEIELSHFHLLRSVGKGAFGKVRVVQHKKTKEIYALKYINKAKCIRMRAVENIIQERRLLEEVEFSLICNLRYAFQDDENLFMVLDLMLGGDLRFHLERAGPMREDVVRFYVAELALALDALHSRRIVHRDLKPDNVLLDEHGHAHLTDFNIAVYYHPSKPLMSIAGSMAYMAPEVLLRKGYFESVDWWSLGVVMFELLFGRRPFRGKSNDLLTNSILRDPLPFPENVHDMISAPCLDVLSRLCERDISKRLGCTPDGLDALKNHPWFNGIEWDKLVTKEATPPFEPDSKRANFDATHELEELLMEDNPLKAKKRAQPTPETELSTEMQLMEDKFIIYDFNKVRRSHSLNRGKITRSGTSQSTNVVSAGGYHDLQKINSTSTLEGTLVATRNSTGRIEQLPMMGAPPPKIPRPESPSDRVGQDRFNPDEDNLSLTSTDLSHRTGAKHEVTQTQAQNPRVSIYRLPEKAEESEDEAVVMLPATTAIPVAPQRSFSHERLTGLPHSGSPDPPQPLIQHHQRQHYANSTTPSSPSNSSGNSSLSTPPTTHNSSPATQKLGDAGTILFSAPDSNASLSSMTPSGTPLMDPASIFNASRPRPRGREASTQQQQQGAPARPMSAYTVSHTSHDEGFQETKSLTMAYIPTLLSQNGFQTSITISGMDESNETPSEATGDHTKHSNSYQTQDVKDEPKGMEKRALAEEAALPM